ncbi:hypothetical protein PRIPAC_92791 [Pristionchus pacificus]|uniref:Uncharacterized protein n=1 Tax=Pristionchus pacificus TaxID=54126 RepID=A0A2A6BQB9_PRIPA|nr:hypothetical protein PRIPAC_92791 [Pristionchus pacificus]|eukprot:PDM68095.1 hypothetical protein PRIPAC_46139 [Pristionchus pacificus]
MKVYTNEPDGWIGSETVRHSVSERGDNPIIASEGHCVSRSPSVSFLPISADLLGRKRQNERPSLSSQNDK